MADSQTVDQVGKAIGLDMERARRDAQGQDVTMELMRTAALAQDLGFTGTPAWITGNRILQGAQGTERLAQAIEDSAETP